MANPLFDHVSPAELASREELIDFNGEVGALEKLSEIVLADLAAADESALTKNWRSAPVEFRLAFTWLEGQAGVPVVSGRAKATLAATCQRCLEAFAYQLDVPIRLLLGGDSTEKDSAGLDEFEAWELSGENVCALDLVEESLIMAMPFAPKHGPQDSCKALQGPVVSETPDTVRPFADLRSIMDEIDT